MGTKAYGDPCYAAALPDEPMFVLLARDPSAPELVRAWAAERMSDIIEGDRPIDDMGQAEEALRCASRMVKWRSDNDGRWRMGSEKEVRAEAPPADPASILGGIPPCPPPADPRWEELRNAVSSARNGNGRPYDRAVRLIAELEKQDIYFRTRDMEWMMIYGANEDGSVAGESCPPHIFAKDAEVCSRCGLDIRKARGWIRQSSEPLWDRDAIINISCDAYMEALSALYGARAVLGDAANISLAIKKMEASSGLEYRGFAPPHRRGTVRVDSDLAQDLDVQARRQAAEAGLGAGHSSAEASISRRANDYQVGGQHYRRSDGVQHWDFVTKTGMHYLPACASKYIGRWRFKDGRQGLEKSLHYIHKAEEEGVGPADNRSQSVFFDYARDNSLNALEILATWALMDADWRGAADAVQKLLASEDAAKVPPSYHPV